MENTPILHDIVDGGYACVKYATQKLTTDHESIKQIMSAPSLFYETLQMVKCEENLSDDENALNTSDEESDCDVDSYTSTPMRPTGLSSEAHTKLHVKNRYRSTEYYHKTENMAAEVKRDMHTATIDNMEFVNDSSSNSKTVNCEGYKCGKCDKQFKTSFKLRSHVDSCIEIKLKKKHECDVCQKVFRKKSSLRDHYFIHTGDRPFKCSQCDHATHTLRCLDEHIRNKHEAHYYQCSVCDKHLKSRSYYKQHMNIHKGVRFPCDKCDKSFTAKHTLNAHLKLHDGETQLVIGPIFNRKTGTLSCELCNKQFSCTDTLNLHMQVHLGTQKFSCATCNVQFSRKTDLKRHETIHTGDKPFKCPKCDMTFRHPGDLSRHKSITHDKSQTCPICDRTFTLKSEYKRHVLAHENGSDWLTGPIYQCSMCERVFESEYNLQKHMNGCRQKTQINQHVHCDVPCDLCCDKCDRTFSSLSNKNRHSRQHLQQAFTCDKCDMTFSSLSSKNRHINRRHLQQTFTCDICSKTFHEKRSMDLHIKCIHMKQLPYPCTLCERQFYKKIELNRHKDKKH